MTLDTELWTLFGLFFIIFDFFDFNFFSFVAAYDDITHMAESLSVDGGDRIVRPAVRFYEVSC